VHRDPKVHGLTRRIATAALVLPALVLVAFAARSYQPFGGEPGDERAASTIFVDSLFTIVLVLGGLAALILLYVSVRRPGRPRGKGSSTYSALLTFLLIFGFLLIGGRALLQYDRQPANEEGSDSAFPTEIQPAQPVAEQEADRDPRLIWPLAAGIVGLIAAAIVIAVIVERRRSRPEGRTPDQLKELTDALDEAIDDLRRDPDPRRAVVAAYARMEQALTVYGLPRRPAEAPYEYLRRVARELEAEQPVAALTELFEVAKFSEHAVDEAMRGRAIDALTAVRQEVRAAT
jgi:hypothetical protein